MNDLLSRSFNRSVSDDSSPPHSHNIEMPKAKFTSGGSCRGGNNLDKFFLDVEEVSSDLKELDRLCHSLQLSHDKSKTLHNAKAVKEMKDKMDSDVSAALKTARRVKENLQALDRANEVNRSLPESGPGSSSDRQRTSVVNGLRKKLKDAMNNFMRVRETISAEYRDTINRLYFTVTGENPDEDTVDRLISTGESETFLQKAIQEQGRGRILDTINEIQERHDAVKDIEKSLNELHQVFLDMAVLVEHQGEQLEDIESHVKRANSLVRSGADKLVKARFYQKNTRKWTCYAILLLIIIVVLVVLFTVKPWDNNNGGGGGGSTRQSTPVGLMQALAVLDLSGNLLSGPIPPILGNLTFTEKMYLHSNKLTGSIPPELGNMSKLHYLELNDNRLTGHLPPELGKLTDLFDLNVANNNLEGLIPDHLSSCTNLISLNVHGNKFSGTIPRAFQKLESMTYLNLSSNNIRGPIPVELSRIGNLDTLDLSNNKINGNIPSSLGDLEHLLKMNLSRNHITGPVPADFGNLRSIMEIDLSNNDISGPIPEELNQLQNLNLLRLENNNLTGNVGSLVNCLSLTVLNVSYNNLVGDIPKSNNFSRFSPDSFIGNPGLCGSWVNSPCHVSRPTVRVSISRAAILGIAIGGCLILVMVLIAACRPHNPPPFLDGSLDNKPVTYSHPKLVILHMNMALHVYEDIMRMTENLSEKYIIGHGASSTVYKCVLKNCKPVAIKRLYSHNNPQSVKHFETELEMLSSIKHRNLVSLQAYSLSPLGSLLFYDYMDNGSLWDLLHGPATKKKTLLDWDARLKIAYGAAQGLAYLHHDCSPRIIHRDVKSSNILLDKDLEARLTDFGIAKSLCISKSHTSTYIMGTIGYIDPEYARTSRLTEKSDVYSYGIVLLELLTSRKAVDDEFNLHHLIMSKTVNNAVMEMADPDIVSTCKDLSVVKKVFQLALLCTKRQPIDRPTMHQVVRVLGSFMLSEQPPASAAAAAAATSATLTSSCYVDEYANLKTPHNVNCSSMSASDAELFLRFGQVISQNSV